MHCSWQKRDKWRSVIHKVKKEYQRNQIVNNHKVKQDQDQSQNIKTKAEPVIVNPNIQRVATINNIRIIMICGICTWHDWIYTVHSIGDIGDLYIYIFQFIAVVVIGSTRCRNSLFVFNVNKHSLSLPHNSILCILLCLTNFFVYNKCLFSNLPSPSSSGSSANPKFTTNDCFLT